MLNHFGKISGGLQTILFSWIVYLLWQPIINYAVSAGWHLIWQGPVLIILLTLAAFEFFGFTLRYTRPYEKLYREGKLKEYWKRSDWPERIKVLSILQLVIAFIIVDYEYRQTIAVMLFGRWPKHELTTDLLRQWYNLPYPDDSYLWDRRRLARWFCDDHLHNDDPGHCSND